MLNLLDTAKETNEDKLKKISNHVTDHKEIVEDFQTLISDILHGSQQGKESGLDHVRRYLRSDMLRAAGRFLVSRCVKEKANKSEILINITTKYTSDMSVAELKEFNSIILTVIKNQLMKICTWSHC